MQLPEQIVLGSRSPQRLVLLQTLVEASRITVCPPLNPDEAGFDGLESSEQFEQRLDEIVSAKMDDVVRQLNDGWLGSNDSGPPVTDSPGRSNVFVICADTTIVGYDIHGRPMALGQPPKDDWQNTVRRWFRDCLTGRPHDVVSGVRVVHIQSLYRHR